MDMRSLELNFELNCFVYDKDFAANDRGKYSFGKSGIALKSI